MKNFILNIPFIIEDFWWDFRKHVACLNELRSVDLHDGKYLSIGAYCKRPLGHKGYHKTGNGRVKWKDV